MTRPDRSSCSRHSSAGILAGEHVDALGDDTAAARRGGRARGRRRSYDGHRASRSRSSPRGARCRRLGARQRRLSSTLHSTAAVDDARHGRRSTVCSRPTRPASRYSCRRYSCAPIGTARCSPPRAATTPCGCACRSRRPRRRSEAGSRRCAPSGFDDRARWRHAVGRLDDARVLALAPPRGLLAVADASPRRGAPRHPRASADAARAARPASCSATPATSRPTSPTRTATSGLSHLLAVSGENVAFVLALVGPLLRRLPLGGRARRWRCVVVLVFAAMTRFEPSVLRASAMAAIALLATLGGRPASRGRVLAVRGDRAARRRPVPPALGRVPAVVRRERRHRVPRTRRSRARSAGPRVVREPLAVSLAAQLGVMPVLLLAFGSFPLVTPLSNLVAAPAAEVLGVYGLVASADRRCRARARSAAAAADRAPGRVGHRRRPRPARRSRSTLDERGALGVLALGAGGRVGSLRPCPSPSSRSRPCAWVSASSTCARAWS